MSLNALVTLNGSGERQQSPARSGGFVTGTGSVGSSGSITNSFRLSADATWELDFFGRVRRTVQAGTAEWQAAEANRFVGLDPFHAQHAE